MAELSVLSVLTIFNYVLVLIFGLFLSVFISGGWETDWQKRLVFLLCPVFLAVQGICSLLWDLQFTQKLYPLIVHLPLVLILVLALKKKTGVSVVSVCTAYLCCQIPRWINLFITAATRSALIGEVCYTVSIIPVFFLLCRFFTRAAHSAMNHSRHSLLLFGSLPIVYYLFDYATAIYSDALYRNGPMISEFLPTALIVFYLLFLTTYQVQEQERSQAVLQNSLLEAQLKQAGLEMEALRTADRQAAIYRHDIRHHLTAIDGFLSAGNSAQAAEYIRSVQADIESVTPKRFCENEMTNLICSSFAARAEQAGVSLSVSVRLPQTLPISDAELCAVLSNGLENALHAAAVLESERRWIKLYCGIRQSNLLVEIKNPYTGEFLMQEGLPVSAREGHGYGCRSIRAIAEQRNGLCSFDADGSTFTLRVMLPVRPL